MSVADASAPEECPSTKRKRDEEEPGRRRRGRGRRRRRRWRRRRRRQRGRRAGSRQYTQQQADDATDAALEATGGGTANSVESDSENGATWEVEVTEPDGDTVDVRLDEHYDVVVIEGDDEE